VKTVTVGALRYAIASYRLRVILDAHRNRLVGKSFDIDYHAIAVSVGQDIATL